MRKKTAVTALSVLALAPALAACGSSGSGSAASSGAGQAASSATSMAASAGSAASSMATKAGKGMKTKASTGANGCTPVSKKGNCYLPKEECKKTQHNLKGIAADGKTIVCKQTGGRWEWQLA